jgi:drug/metabolite transporter (DMT)-like permease
MAFAALSIIWGFPYFLIKVAVADVPPLMIAWSRVTLAALILVPIAWRRGALDAIGPLAASLAISSAVLLIPALRVMPGRLPPAATIGSIAALGIVWTALAMMLMFYLVHHAGASRATLITYLNPAVASLLGVALLHERLGASGLLAFALILIGSWLATRAAPPKLVERAAER